LHISSSPFTSSSFCFSVVMVLVQLLATSPHATTVPVDAASTLLLPVELHCSPRRCIPTCVAVMAPWNPTATTAAAVFYPVTGVSLT
ncbi:hypothetical protein O3P69_010529, partial [Scylla paramamosain]